MTAAGRLRRWTARRLLLSVLLCGLAPPVAAQAPVDFERLETLPPGEQYRKLSLLLLVAGGVEAELVEMLPAGDIEAGALSLDLDDFVTPLVRIVNQEAMLASAARLFSFARERQPEIERRLTAIGGAHPILVSMIDIDEIVADAIIIRNSVADSIEYSGRIDDPQAPARVRAFREQTAHLRNMMEYNRFQKKLTAITEQAIVDLGGRLDAYQRMFDEEIDPELIERRVRSAEIMSTQTGDDFDEQAAMRTDELLLMLILMESEVR